MENRDKPIFNLVNFSLWLFKGILHSFVNFYICINIVYSSINKKGFFGDLWFTSVNLFSNIIIIVTIDLIVFTLYHTFINFSLIFLTSFVFYLFFS